MEMDPLLHLRYLSWADNLILDAVQQLPAAEYEKDRGSSHGGIKGTLAHMYRADMVWFSRVAGEPFANIADVPVPEPFRELRHEWLTLHERWQNWIAQLGSNQFGIAIRYSNSQGAACSTPIWQVLLHLASHGAYHRGQVATMLRQAGVKPPGTDFLMFYRCL
jgi:uncharacterized damage-inducible protein DinB